MATLRFTLGPYTMLSNLVLRWALVGLALKVLWKLLKNYVIKSPVDLIPGPSPETWFKGALHICLVLLLVVIRPLSRPYVPDFCPRCVAFNGQLDRPL